MLPKISFQAFQKHFSLWIQARHIDHMISLLVFLGIVLLNLYLCCMSVIPHSKNHALVQSIPKKRDHFNPSNYQPIALTSTIPRVFSSLHDSHFFKYPESHSLLFDYQCNFSKVRSTSDILSFVTNISLKLSLLYQHYQSM